MSEAEKEVGQEEKGLVLSPEEVVQLEHIDQAGLSKLLLPQEPLGPQTLERAKERLEIHQGLKRLALQATNPGDWVIFGDKPYLTDKGCQKFAEIYGISFPKIEIEAMSYQDEKGPVVEFFATVTAVYQNRIETDSSSAATSEVFFNGLDKDGKPRRLPLSLINRSDVRKKAITGAKARVVRRLLGLNFELKEVEDALRAASKDPTKIPRVSFKEGKKGGKKRSKGKQNKEEKNYRAEIARMLLELTGGDKEEAANLLEQLSAFTGSDGQAVSGVRSPKQLTDNWARITYARVKEYYNERKGTDGGEKPASEEPESPF